MPHKLMKVLFLLLVLFSTLELDAQTFTCVDVRFANTLATKGQKIKQKAIGTTAVFKFYGRNVVITTRENNSTENQTIVLQKIEENKYHAMINRCSLTLQLKTSMGVITQAKLTGWQDNKATQLIYKRKFF